MKSKFFGINVKLALMLVAVCGIFASCYEKEEIDVAKPNTEAAKYFIKGVVTNATTGIPLQGASVNTATTDASGVYELTTSPGLQTITIKKDGFVPVVTSVNVVAIENGKTAVYTVNAGLYEGEEDLVYMENKYNIEGNVFDQDGKNVTLTEGSVTIPGLKVNVEGSKFTSIDAEGNDIEPGTYAAIVNVAGYEKGYAQIIITDAGQKVGDGVNTVTTKVQVVLQKEADVESAKYIVEGNVRNANGVIISDANITLKLTSSNESYAPDSYKNGYYSFTLPNDKVVPTTVARVTISKNGYYSYSYSFLVKLVNAGETSVSSINVTLKEIAAIGDEDPSIGGDVTADILGDGSTTEEKSLADVKVIEATTADGGKTTVDELLASMKKSTGEEVNAENLAVVTTPATSVSVDLRSEVVVGEGSGAVTKTEIDQIIIAPNSQVIFTQANNGSSVAENISVSRNIATEKATAAIRVYEGTPNGTVFVTPLKVNFASPVAGPDFLLGVLYFNDKTGVWVSDELGGKPNYAEHDGTTFVGNISHFSKFRFGFESKKDSISTTPLTPDFVEKACFTGSAPQLVTIKGTYMGGSMYDGLTPSMAAADKLKGMNETSIAYVADLLTKMIKADNLNIAPKNGYVKTSLSVDKTISSYRQVKGFNITRSELVKKYTVKVIKKDKTSVDVTVTVKSIISYDLTVVDEPNHSHGHGHGDNLNQGGGIIEFE